MLAVESIADVLGNVREPPDQTPRDRGTWRWQGMWEAATQADLEGHAIEHLPLDLPSLRAGDKARAGLTHACRKLLATDAQSAVTAHPGRSLALRVQPDRVQLAARDIP